jgi:NTP pyrophosphatase (non-canonical NTP hydrolase)
MPNPTSTTPSTPPPTCARTADNRPADLAATCNGHAVAVIVIDDQHRALIGDRTDDVGYAPVTSHVADPGAGYRDAAIEAVALHVGLTVTELAEITGGWRGDRCVSGNSAQGTGHTWQIYQATVTGDLADVLTVDQGRYHSVRWADSGELQQRAHRTLAFAVGDVTAEQWNLEPGLAPVWVYWLHITGLITMSRSDLDVIEHLVEHGATADLPPAGPHEDTGPEPAATPMSDLARLGARIAARLREHFPAESEPIRQVLAVAEEAGEFVGAFRRAAGLARRSGPWDDVESELADVVLAAFTTAAALRIDLDFAINAKTERLFSRNWRDPR